MHFYSTIFVSIWGGGTFFLDPHRVHCTAITKQLKFYVRLVTRVDSYTLQGRSLPVPQNWGKYSATNIDQIAIHLFILETCKCSCDGCVINNLVCLRFNQ